MLLTATEKRFSAILVLQNKQKKHHQGSFLYEVYDKAIDLALNPQRQVNDFFTRNLFRDAKRTLKRQNEAIPSFVDLSPDNSIYTEESMAIDSYTALDALIYHDFQASINRLCPTIHPLAEQVLRGLIDDLSCNDLAKTLGVSESLVKKIRVNLRKSICKIIMN